MQYRSLGASGLTVPVIGLNTANFGTDSHSGSGLGERLAARLVDISIERGSCFLETSDSEPDAQSQLCSILGKRRSKLLIAASIGSQAREGQGQCLSGSGSRHHLVAACEQSLLRLGSDYLDLLHIQSFDPQTPLEETLSTLDCLIRSGKVRYIGCSRFAGWQLMKALALSDRHAWPRFISQQLVYSLAERGGENEVMPLGADQNVGSLARGGLAGGILAGNFGRNGRVPASAQSRMDALVAVPRQQLTAIIDSLGDVSRETGASKAQAALAWLLLRPTISSVIVSVSCVEQLEANLDAIDVILSGDQLARLDEVSEPVLPRESERPHQSEAMHSISPDRTFVLG